MAYQLRVSVVGEAFVSPSGCMSRTTSRMARCLMSRIDRDAMTRGRAEQKCSRNYYGIIASRRGGTWQQHSVILKGDVEEKALEKIETKFKRRSLERGGQIQKSAQLALPAVRGTCN